MITIKKSVPIQIYIGENAVNPQIDWKLGIWTYGTEAREVWGLIYYGGTTQMCYGMDYAEPYSALADVKSRFSRDVPIWLFDVGRNLGAKIEDLEAAFKEMGYEAPESVQN